MELSWIGHETRAGYNISAAGVSSGSSVLFDVPVAGWHCAVCRLMKKNCWDKSKFGGP